jgi:hypothetical protein
VDGRRSSCLAGFALRKELIRAEPRNLESSVLRRLHHSADGEAHLFPSLILTLELFSPRLGQLIEFGFAVVFRDPPLGFNPSLILQPVESWIERAFPDRQDVIGPFLNALADAKTVHGLATEHFEDKHVESALKQVWLLHTFQFYYHRMSTGV